MRDGVTIVGKSTSPCTNVLAVLSPCCTWAEIYNLNEINQSRCCTLDLCYIALFNGFPLLIRTLFQGPFSKITIVYMPICLWSLTDISNKYCQCLA